MADRKRQRLQNASIPSRAARLLSGGVDRAEDGVTAAGTTISDAYELSKPVTRVSSIASGAGVKLTDTLSDEPFVIVHNSGANSLSIYPESSSDTIDGGSAGASIPLSQSNTVLLTKVTSTDWMSIGLTVASDFALEVARGNISGVTAVHKFGYNPDIDTNTLPEDVWTPGGLYVSPTAARTHDVVSTSVNDFATGTGAQTVRIYGLTSWSSAEVSEDITLNGTTDVETANDYVIINRMRVLTVGNGHTAAGTITATAQTDSTISAQITTGADQSEQCIYGVPSTQTLYLTNWGASIARDSGGDGAADVDLMINPDPTDELEFYQIKAQVNLYTDGTGDFYADYNPYLAVPGPAIVKVEVERVTRSDTQVDAEFQGYLVDN